MIPLTGMDLPRIRQVLTEKFRDAPPVKTERWQGVPLNTDTRELRNVCFEVDLQGIEDLDHWRRDTGANVPWADDHFAERVGGEPLNPGVQWANWPWGLSAAKFKTDRFNHTYMERLWPKFARRTPDGRLPKGMKTLVRKYPMQDHRPLFGIGSFYGDLWDLVDLLAKEPHTRQAFIPLFFPEDTGVSDGGRKVCTLGYQFLVRDKKIHLWYPLRSCDFVRHWSDDCYLAIRLLLWVLEKCRTLNPKFWAGVVPGTFAMHMTSLHIFESDRERLV